VKHKIKTLGIIVLAALIGFSMAACDNSGGGGSGAGHLGSTLNLSGQVWTMDWDNDDRITWEQFTGNRSISAGFWYDDGWDDIWIDIGGSGSINAGQLSFTIGTPDDLVSISTLFDGEIEDEFHNFRISDPDARAAVFGGFRATGAGRSGELLRMWLSGNTFEGVSFLYVDRNVTIAGGGRTTTWDCDCGVCRCEEWDDRCYCASRFITRNLNINLRTGWNAIHFREVWSFSGGMDTYTLTLSLGDPARLRWVLDEWGGGFQGFSETSESSERALSGRLGARRLRAIR